jgi:hypothetical protein
MEWNFISCPVQAYLWRISTIDHLSDRSATCVFSHLLRCLNEMSYLLENWNES